MLVGKDVIVNKNENLFKIHIPVQSPGVMSCVMFVTLLSDTGVTLSSTGYTTNKKSLRLILGVIEVLEKPLFSL